ncbi:MAG: response regulator [Flavobacterium sp.]|nr:response regulator [Flavobacterium sp.]
MNSRSQIALDCNIFYVDDDRDDLELFQEMAESLGENVCVFSSAELMMHTLNNPPPDPTVLFVDLNMPIRNGYEVLAELRASPIFKEIPIVVLSTASAPDIITRCLNLGASLYVVKPTAMKDLRNLIQYVAGIEWKTREVTTDNFLYKAK